MDRKLGVRPLWTSAEAAQFLRVHEATVRRLAARGDIPCLRLGKFIRFSPLSLRVWAAQGAPRSVKGGSKQ